MNTDQKKISQSTNTSNQACPPVPPKPQNQTATQPAVNLAPSTPINNTNIKGQPQQNIQNPTHPQSQAPSSNFSKGDDVFNSQHPNQTSITLLSRGLKLLSISHLRQLLRDYSLPTGGNKQALVDRLILYLETFGPKQQALVVQFSVNLKKLLSVDSTETNEESSSNSNNTQNQANSEQTPPSAPTNPDLKIGNESFMQLIPPNVSDKLFEISPSCLFAATGHQLAFGPVMIESKNPPDNHEFTLINPTQGYIPILQFAPVFPDSPLKSITLQLTHKNPITLTEPMLWCPVSDYVNKSGSFQVKSTDPSVPVIAVVRWLKKLQLSEVMKNILAKDDLPDEVPENLNDESNNNDNMRFFSSISSKGICPFTRKIMLYPARGKHCMHRECFDMSGYLSMCIKTNQWVCPFCHKTLYAEDLRFDPNYFLFVKNK
ncbi:hypothetical protein M9Y10_033729 [Tritrichomonas musculus]|uniref:SAP domain-containing protein n=1 Tax=Tritrichomonas musculus TaxID=1915356 RepID=A0ABR2KDM2_9EUKA